MHYLDFQRDKEYFDEIMTSASPIKDPLKRQWVDHLGDYGCLVTCVSNVILMTVNSNMNPKILNGIIRDNKGYQYLGNPNIPENEASLIRWEIFERLFPQFEYTYHTSLFVDDPRSFYIAKVHLFTNDDEHHINVLRQLTPSKYLCFDVWDGKLKIYDRNKIIDFHVLRLK